MIGKYEAKLYQEGNIPVGPGMGDALLRFIPVPVIPSDVAYKEDQFVGTTLTGAPLQ